MKKKVNAFYTMMFIVFLCSNSIFAQQKTKVIAEDNNGLRTIEFQTEKGIITTYLPSSLYAGDIISGTVVAEPKGKNEKQVEKNKNILNGYIIELEEKETPVDQGKEKWKLPDDIKDGLIYLVLKDPKDLELGRMSIPVNIEVRRLSVPDMLGESDFDIPSYFEIGKPIHIPGYFDGDFTTSGIMINDVPADIIAESPGGLFFESQMDINGPIDMELTEGDFIIEGQANVLDMNLSAIKLTLTKGEQTRVNISVSGLDGLDMEVPLKITNLTPGNIDLPGGNNQEIIIEPDDVSDDGVFNYDLDVTAVSSGGFSVMVNIKPPLSKTIKLLSPKNGEIYNSPVSQPIAFEWTFIGNSFATLAVSYDLKIWQLTEEMIEGITPSIVGLLDMKPYFVEERIKEASLEYEDTVNFPLMPEFVYAWQINSFDNTGNLIATSEVWSFVVLSQLVDMDLGQDDTGKDRSELAVKKLGQALDSLKYNLLKISEFEDFIAKCMFNDINDFLKNARVTLGAWKKAVAADPTLGMEGISKKQKKGWTTKYDTLWFDSVDRLEAWQKKSLLPKKLQEELDLAQKKANEAQKKAEEAEDAFNSGSLDKAIKAEKEKKKLATQVKKLLNNAERLAKEIQNTAKNAANKMKKNNSNKWNSVENAAKINVESLNEVKSQNKGKNIARILEEMSNKVLIEALLYEKLKMVRDYLKNNNKGTLKMFNEQIEVVKGVKKLIAKKEKLLKDGNNKFKKTKDKDERKNLHGRIDSVQKDVNRMKGIVKNIREASKLLTNAAIHAAKKIKDLKKTKANKYNFKTALQLEIEGCGVNKSYCNEVKAMEKYKRAFIYAGSVK